MKNNNNDDGGGGGGEESREIGFKEISHLGKEVLCQSNIFFILGWKFIYQI